jgi:hypothetical protein
MRRRSIQPTGPIAVWTVLATGVRSRSVTLEAWTLITHATCLSGSACSQEFHGATKYSTLQNLLRLMAATWSGGHLARSDGTATEFHKQFISERLKRLLQSARNEQVADSFARGFLEQRSTRRRTLRVSLLAKD